MIRKIICKIIQDAGIEVSILFPQLRKGSKLLISNCLFHLPRHYGHRQNANCGKSSHKQDVT